MKRKGRVGRGKTERIGKIRKKRNQRKRKKRRGGRKGKHGWEERRGKGKIEEWKRSKADGRGGNARRRKEMK